MNNKTLGIIFSSLLLLYLLVKLLGGNKERSFDSNIITIDTSQVTTVIVDPKGEDPSFTLTRSDNGWTVSEGSQTYVATSSSVGSLLNNLQNIEAQRVVARGEEKWPDYEVDESGTRITTKAGNKILSDIHVGRFSFNQVNRTSTSYIRPEKDDAVYAIDGFMSMSLGQGMNNYRNKRLVQLTATDIKQIKLQETGRTTTFSKADNQWFAGSELIDSSGMASYLNGLQSVSGIDFTNSQVQNNPLLQSLEIAGDNMDQPILVNCYASNDTTKIFALQSNINPEGYFLSDSTSIYERTFTKLKNLLGN